MFPFSSPLEHQEILGAEKGNIFSKWVKLIADLVLGLLWKSANKQTFNYWKLVFNPSIVNDEIL